MNTFRPFHLLGKPTGAACNLDCKYCFFLSKEMLYPGDRFRMSDELLEAYIRQLLEAQPSGEVNVAWQGGEPLQRSGSFTLLPPIVALNRKPPTDAVDKATKIENPIQT